MNKILYLQTRCYVNGMLVLCEEDHNGAIFDEMVKSNHFDRVEFGKFLCSYDRDNIESNDEFKLIRSWIK